jgi:hypothetical protein
MSDNELLKLAYEAYGFRLHSMSSAVLYHQDFGTSIRLDQWNPLIDDMQAFHLIQRLSLHIDQRPGKQISVQDPHFEHIVYGTDLNRAVVECAAKIQHHRSNAAVGSQAK